MNLVCKIWRPFTLNAQVKASNIATLKVKGLFDKLLLFGIFFLGNPVPTEDPRGGLLFEHIFNKRTNLRVLSNRSSLNIVMQSWNCWHICTYCRIFISWLKQKGKKVQDPVHITSNWINVLFNTPASPIIPGRWVSWKNTFSSWWDSKVWSPFWYYFLCKTLPETTHTANCIVRFWMRAWNYNTNRNCM